MRTLNDLKKGESCIIEKINNTGSIRRRFRDIGLIEKTKVKCVGASPSGDPKAFLIRSAVIAIRSEDSKFIDVSEG